MKTVKLPNGGVVWLPKPDIIQYRGELARAVRWLFEVKRKSK